MKFRYFVKPSTRLSSLSPTYYHYLNSLPWRSISIVTPSKDLTCPCVLFLHAPFFLVVFARQFVPKLGSILLFQSVGSRDITLICSCISPQLLSYGSVVVDIGGVPKKVILGQCLRESELLL